MVAKVSRLDRPSALAEVDARRLYLELGFPSMFAYCTEALHFSEAAAYNRILVARVAREFPALLAAVQRGEVHLTGLRLLAPHLTRENVSELLAAARHKTKRQVAELLADRTPVPDVRPSIRRLPPAPSTPALETARMQKLVSVRGEPGDTPRPASARTSAPEPQGLGRFKLHFTIGPEAHEKLKELQALLRHQIPDGDLAVILERAIGLLHAQARKQRFAQTDAPRIRLQMDGPSRHIPAAIKRAVAERDGGRCTFLAKDGRRCGARDFIEFHHLDPWARSHSHSIEGITLRCRAHNQYAARREYGEAEMTRRSTCSGTS